MKFVKIPGQSFKMQDAPVTQREWFKVMKTKPSYFKNKPNNPVESVSYDEVKDFVKNLNTSQKKYTYRLPTEQEWELCANSCDEQKIDQIAWYWENSNKATHPIRKKKSNNFGLYDMLGNVWELTDSLWSMAGSDRVLRGGSWDYNAQVLRSAYRGSISSGIATRVWASAS